MEPEPAPEEMEPAEPQTDPWGEPEPAPVEPEPEVEPVEPQPEWVEPQAEPTEPQPAPPADTAEPETGMQRIGASVSAGGGVSDFSRSSARDFTDFGGSWELRGAFGTRTIVGVEAAYIGTANEIHVPGDADTLYGNGLELAGRLNILRNRGQASGLQPYVLAGVGWKNYQLSGNLPTAAVDDDDNTFEVPVGGGLAYYFENGLILDGRFAYRFSFWDDLIQPAGEDDASLDNWSATAKLGLEF